MDKRVALAAVLSTLVLLVWMWLFPVQEPPREPPVPETVQRAAPGPVHGPSSTAAATPAEVPAAQPISAAVEEVVRVSTGQFDVTLTNRGGVALSWKLRDYTTAGGEALELLPQSRGLHPRTLGLDLDDASLAAALDQALYRVERAPVESDGARPPGERIRFTFADERGIEVVKTIVFREGTHLVDLELQVTDRGRRLPARLALGPGFGAQEPGDEQSTYYYHGQTVWNHEGTVTRRKSGEESGRFSARLRWAGLEDQYFAILLLPGDEATEVAWRPVELEAEPPRPDAEPREGPKGPEPLLSVAMPEGRGQLFVGPKKLTLLRELGGELDRVVWFSSYAFLAWIAKFIFLCLLWIHDHTIQNYGLAIILATFLLRLLLFPINQYSMVSMKKSQVQMQRLQPKMKAIRAKYKKAKDSDSRAKMNQEVMDLYRKEGVNPMGGLSGCLPLLAQFPILIGFYNMLTVAFELRGAAFFGWIRDLSRADPYWVTPLLMGVTMAVQQKLAMSKIKDPVQQQQQRVMMIMPVVFTVFCIGMPSGMVLYWFVNNLLGIGQQWLVNRHTARLEAAEQKV
jgi:YidC/Oxa1 family membrane protein insertase